MSHRLHTCHTCHAPRRVRSPFMSARDEPRINASSPYARANRCARREHERCAELPAQPERSDQAKSSVRSVSSTNPPLPDANFVLRLSAQVVLFILHPSSFPVPPLVKSRKSAEIRRNSRENLCFPNAHAFTEIGFARRVFAEFVGAHPILAPPRRPHCSHAVKFASDFL